MYWPQQAHGPPQQHPQLGARQRVPQWVPQRATHMYWPQQRPPYMTVHDTMPTAAQQPEVRVHQQHPATIHSAF